MEETPAAPLTAVTGGVKDALTAIADNLAAVSENDPTGLATLLAQTIGQPQSGDNDANGLVGTVNSLSQGLAAGVEDTPLEQLINPLTQVLGADEDQAVDGVASGLGSVGETLAADESPLAPLTADLLAPIVGSDPETDGAPGLSGTLDQVGEGLTDLTNPDSALAPLDPLTSALQDPVLSTLSDGISQLGDALVSNSEMAGPGAGLLTTLGTLLGGEADTGGGNPPPASGPTGTPLDTVLGPVADAVMGSGEEPPATPLDPLTAALMENSDPAVFAESLTGIITDTGNNTPLQDATDQLADAIAGGGGGSEGPTGTPLDAVLGPVAEAVMGGDSVESPIPTDPSALTDLLTSDASPIGSLPAAPGPLQPVIDQLSGLAG